MATVGTLVQEYNDAARLIEEYESGQIDISEIRNKMLVRSGVEQANRKLVAMVINAGRVGDQQGYSVLYKHLIGQGKQTFFLPKPKQKLYDRTTDRGRLTTQDN